MRPASFDDKLARDRRALRFRARHTDDGFRVAKKLDLVLHLQRSQDRAHEASLTADIRRDIVSAVNFPGAGRTGIEEST